MNSKVSYSVFILTSILTISISLFAENPANKPVQLSDLVDVDLSLKDNSGPISVSKEISSNVVSSTITQTGETEVTTRVVKGPTQFDKDYIMHLNSISRCSLKMATYLKDFLTSESSSNNNPIEKSIQDNIIQLYNFKPIKIKIDSDSNYAYLIVEDRRVLVATDGHLDFCSKNFFLNRLNYALKEALNLNLQSDLRSINQNEPAKNVSDINDAIKYFFDLQQDKITRKQRPVKDNTTKSINWKPWGNYQSLDNTSTKKPRSNSNGLKN